MKPHGRSSPLLPLGGSPLLAVLLLAGSDLHARQTSAPGPRHAAAPAPAGPPRAVPGLAWADVDADGLDDVLTAGPSGTVTLWRNRGAGDFEDATAAAGLAGLTAVRQAAFGDADADGLPDLYVVAEGGSGRLFHNAAGAFVDVTDLAGLGAVEGARDAFWSDSDGDGLADLWVSGRGVTLWHNRGSLAFAPTDLGAAAVVAPAAAAVPGGRDADAAEAGAGASSAAERLAAGEREAEPASPSSDSSSSASSVSASPAPPAKSSAVCAPLLADQAGGGCLGASSVPELGLLYPLSEDLFVSANGRVGIGTTTPARPLEVASAGQSILRMTSEGSANGSVVELLNDSPEQSLIGGINFVGLEGTTGQILYASNDTMQFVVEDEERMRIISNGKVAIGTGFPRGRLTVVEPDGSPLTSPALFASANGGAAGFFDGPLNTGYLGEPFGFQLNRVQMSTDPVTKAGRVLVYNDSSLEAVKLGVDSTAGGFVRLRNPAGTETVLLDNDSAGNGYARFDRGDGLETLWLHSNYAGTGKSRVVTDVLEIRGGADLVEGFETGAEQYEPGTVLTIDPDRPGELTEARTAYDPRVAGVVSGAGGVQPGLRMGQEGVASGDTPVALTGRVYVKCTAENGAVRPGDLLTTADTAGHAMRADDRERSFGAVIGKAMSSLDSGSGLVLVLVNLQ